MARKTVGHVELQWTCPNCRGVNPGPVRVCGNCGAVQPADVKFEQAARPVLIDEEAEKARAEAASGADIHCPFCGTRNPASAKTCSQCGGDLASGLRRESGTVVGAFTTGPAVMVKCPRCGAENPDTALTCSQCGASLKAEPAPPAAAPAPLPAAASRKASSPWLIAVLVLGGLVLCGVLAYAGLLLTRTDAVTGVVQGVQWERSIPVEALVPVQRQAWEDDVPPEASLGSCQEEVRGVQDEPGPDTIEVCGDPYTVDSGDGYGEVVQDCEYQVMDQYCTYSIEEWQVVDTVSARGEGLDAFWPAPVAGEDRRMGSQVNETYTIVFQAGGETYSYQTGDFELFQQASIGSQWQLDVNRFGSVVSIQP
jgi:ribosomal protein L40E